MSPFTENMSTFDVHNTVLFSICTPSHKSNNKSKKNKSILKRNNSESIFKGTLSSFFFICPEKIWSFYKRQKAFDDFEKWCVDNILKGAFDSVCVTEQTKIHRCKILAMVGATMNSISAGWAIWVNGRVSVCLEKCCLLLIRNGEMIDGCLNNDLT